MLDLDESLQGRIEAIKIRQEEVTKELSGLDKRRNFSEFEINEAKVNKFCAHLREKLSDSSSRFGKEYLKILVDKVTVEGNEVRVSGGHAALAGAINSFGIKKEAGQLHRSAQLRSSWLPSADKSAH